MWNLQNVITCQSAPPRLISRLSWKKGLDIEEMNHALWLVTGMWLLSYWEFHDFQYFSYREDLQNYKTNSDEFKYKTIGSMLSSWSETVSDTFCIVDDAF